jgi:hypothetical protein
MTAQEAPGTGSPATEPSVTPSTAVVLSVPRTGHTLVLTDRLLVGSLTLLALLLRLPTIGRAYWVDEGISIGISSHPVSQIPSLLRHDGSPPGFYFLLHYWMVLFGSSEPATHALPLLTSLVAIPVAYRCASDVFDRRAGLAAAALVATNPFMAWYSTETRMYPLVVLLGIVGMTLAWRAVTHRRVADAAGAVVTFALLMYTHDWGIYLTGVTAAVLLLLALSRGDRALAAGVALCSAAVLALWLPWLPTFVAQAGNTAAPWAVQPGIGDFFADPSSALGGTVGFIVTPLLVFGIVISKPDRSVRDGYVSGLFGAIGLLTTLAGFLGAQIEPSWTVRYLAAVVGPLLLACAGALAPSRRGRLVVVSVCLILVLWSVTGTLLPNKNARYAKSNVAAIAAGVSHMLHPGDVVVLTQTEQLPVLYHYLPKGLTYVTPTGAVPDPTYVDWTRIIARLQAAVPCEDVAPAIDALPIGGQVLEVDPARALGATGSSWSKAVNAQVGAVDSMLARDPGLTPVDLYDEALYPKPFSPVEAILYQKTAARPACQ